ncbi:1-alkyl-2-acetylglycerophosphocholine esterase [Synchytrium microbalum]|uniref:Putative phospholipase n=1 Tax=Synchytrium microbalum TaxID=1806994 RepID=A0A507BVR3_9FUNG|nr:1-alkyl-2-acetylglycerophosphocholine esterase [Synchytrium microbalum]TPX31298.1 1-alkyl-2-acetylglycerophosphocholine esterase [Synchytrium microbalum]
MELPQVPSSSSKFSLKWLKPHKRGLPSYSGRFAVGTFDVESPKTETGLPGVLFRAFYPADPSCIRKFRKAQWSPSINHVAAYGEGWGLSGSVSSIVLPILFSPRSAAFFKAPLLSGDERLPIVIFSHGLVGNRSSYSTLCGEIASHGFVVIALEHRDHSAILSQIGGDAGTHLKYIRRRGSTPEALWKWRVEQQNLRAQEVAAAIEALRNMDTGRTIFNYLGDTPTWFESRLDFNNMVMMGHSFGGFTALSVTQTTNPFKCAVFIDTWFWYAALHGIDHLLKDHPTYNNDVTIPFLFISSENFHEAENLAAVQKLFNNPTRKEDSIHSLILGSRHHNASDFLCIAPLTLWLIGLGGAADPRDVLRTQTDCILAFVSRHVRLPENLRLLPSNEALLTGKGGSRNVSVGFQHVIPKKHTRRTSMA